MAADVKKLKKRRLKEGKSLRALLYSIWTGALHKIGYLDTQALNDMEKKRYLYSASRIILGTLFSSLLARTQLAFSVYPLGIAFVSAAGRCAPIYAASALIASLTLGSRSAVYAVALLLVLLMRTGACIYSDMREEGLGRFPLYNELAPYRIVFSCIAAFTVGIYNLFYGDFSYYALLGSLTVMTLCPISAYIFIHALEPGEYSEHRDVARLFLCSVLVWSLTDVSIGTLSLADCCAFLLVATEQRKGKCAYSAIMGLAVGLPMGIEGAAVYALCGVVSHLLSGLSKTLGCIGAFTFLVLAIGYTGGYSALVGCLGGSTLGLSAALLWVRYDIHERLGGLWLGFPEVEARTPAVSVGDAAERISDVSHTFSSLSEMLKNLCAYSERSRLLDTKAIVEGVCDEICTECKRRGECWGEDSSRTADAMGKLAASLSRAEKPTAETLPAYLREKCQRKDKLASLAGKRMASATQKALSDTGCRLLASDYEAMSRILDSHLEKAKEQTALDRPLSQQLSAYSRANGLGIGAVSVWGQRIKKIYAYGIDLSRHTVSASELCEAFSKIAKCRLCSPVYAIDGSDVEFEMHSLPTISVRCSQASLAKEGEGVCGDSSRYFENKDGYFYSVLCDGMGSGREAARTSSIAVEYISSMLGHSNPKDLTVEMLNAVLRHRSGECSSTVDLFEADTYTGEGCFIKSGAAPSFVVRKNNVYKVAARTIPIGITDRIKAEKIKLRLRPGDIVVMASDGVVDGAEGVRAAVETLCKRTTDEPLDIAGALLCAAKSRGISRDDMTVCVAVIEKAKEE